MRARMMAATAIVVLVPAAAGVARVAAARFPPKKRTATYAVAAGDGQATRAYVAIVRGMLANVAGNRRGIEMASAEEMVNARDGCRAIAAAAPANSTRWRVAAGISAEVVATAAHADAAIVTEYRGRVDKIHWSEHGITALVERSALAVEQQAYLPHPPLCALVRQWVNTRFKRIPSRLSMLTRQLSVLSERGVLVPHPLEAYIDAGDLATLRDVQRLERVIAGYLRPDLLKARADILRIVGLSAHPAYAHP
jgi:hypothetical protein